MELSLYVWKVTGALSLLAVAGQVIIVGLAGLIVFEAYAGRRTAVTAWVSNHSLTLMLVVSLTATLGSLYFSEIVGWVPCKYCWIQRIFMYPQPILLAIAIWKRDRQIARYVVALCALGAAVALYHYCIQLTNIVAGPANPATPCDASGESCVKTPFVMFGYITIPMLALTAFALNAVASATFIVRQRAN